jgi:hypothetical protein
LGEWHKGGKTDSVVERLSDCDEPLNADRRQTREGTDFEQLVKAIIQLAHGGGWKQTGNGHLIETNILVKMGLTNWMFGHEQVPEAKAQREAHTKVQKGQQPNVFPQPIRRADDAGTPVGAAG